MERDSAIDFESSKWTSRFLILVLLLSLVLVLWSQSPYLWDKYRVIKDVQNFYWMARYWDPDLFPVDHVYLSSGRVIELDVLGLPFLLYPASLGYALLFYPATLVLDYIWVSKMLIFVLMPLCIVYLFKLGKLLRGNRTALSLSLLFVFFILASPQSISIASGLQRGFAVPMLIAFLYYMTARKHLAASLMVLVALLIYAPDFPLMVLAYTLSMVKVGRPFKPSLDLSRHRLVPFGLVLLVSLLVLGLMVVSQRGLLADLAPSEGSLPAEEGDSLQDSVGEKAPLSQDPQYQTEGSMPLFDVFPWFGRAGMFDMGADVLNFFILLVFCFLIYSVIGRRSLQQLPSVFWWLLAAGIIMYAASLFAVLWFSTFALYLPSRYMRSTLIVIALCFVGVNWGDFVDGLPSWFRRNARLVVFFVVSLCLALGGAYVFSPTHFPWLAVWQLAALALRGILVMVGGGVFMWALRRPGVRIIGKGKLWKKGMRVMAFLLIGTVMVVSSAGYIRTLETEPINPPQAARDVYEFVATLPKDAMFAGEPEVMTGIPAFSRRSVLIRGLFPKGPVVQSFDAQYAESPEAVLSFCERYGVDYLVIDSTVFSPEYLARDDFFYQPYNDQIVKLVAGRSDFALLDVEPIFASGSLSVIKCDADTLLGE